MLVIDDRLKTGKAAENAVCGALLALRDPIQAIVDRRHALIGSSIAIPDPRRAIANPGNTIKDAPSAGRGLGRARERRRPHFP
jgi:hypothetical protein